MEPSFEGGRARVSIPMIPSDAFFVVFSDGPFVPAGSRMWFDSRNETPSMYLALQDDWRVHFSQKGGGKADEYYTELHSWTESTDPIVRYFSGTAVYTTVFSMRNERLESSGRILLDLGDVRNIAEVTLNGKPAGVLWKAPFRTEDIKPLLREGDNTLEVKVTNLWRNRMIGDVQPGETHPVTSIRRFYKAGDPLLPSGLLGPVTVIGL